MKRFNFLVLPYRDQYFMGRYGPSVRDLQIICALSRAPRVQRLTAINRPVSIYERALGIKRPSIARAGGRHAPQIQWQSRLSLDPFGPLLGRRWMSTCYLEYSRPTYASALAHDGINVFLDFSPISVVEERVPANALYWYDLIDNFVKHNRYGTAERALVEEKYRYVRACADLVTGVSAKALGTFNAPQVLTNGVGICRQLDDPPLSSDYPPADFGFIGFITDKFDCNAIRTIACAGYTINIFGESYDRRVTRTLSSIPNVRLLGRFQSAQLAGILTSFKVGLIPYLREKLHDESPLKLYQYLNAGMPVLSSAQFEISDPAIVVYGDQGVDLIPNCALLLRMAGNRNARARIRALVGDEDFWDRKVDRILDHLTALDARRTAA